MSETAETAIDKALKKYDEIYKELPRLRAIEKAARDWLEAEDALVSLAAAQALRKALEDEE